MNAFGLLLWFLAALILVAAVAAAVVGTKARPEGLDRLYVWFCWLTLPLAIPLVLIRVMPPPGPQLPAALTIVAVVRAFLGLLLAVVGLALAARAATERRPFVLLLLTVAANVLPFLLLVLRRE